MGHPVLIIFQLLMASGDHGCSGHHVKEIVKNQGSATVTIRHHRKEGLPAQGMEDKKLIVRRVIVVG